jgi:carbon-monoxide dehydrogenase small subunit
MSDALRIAVTVNGVEHERLVEPRRLLVDFLREDLELTGTHIGCEQGVCGACTVLVNGQSLRSCLLFAVQADGAEIMTVEGLANNGELHPLQQAFTDEHGLQCGFCTPGMLMGAYELLLEQPLPEEGDVRAALSGNLCRCTGYQNILKAVHTAAERISTAQGTPSVT